MSRSLCAFTLRDPVASSSATLPIGPHSKLKAPQRFLSETRLLSAERRGRERPSASRRTCGGVRMLLTSVRGMEVANR